MDFAKKLAIAVILAGPIWGAASAAAPVPAAQPTGDQGVALDEYSVTAGHAPDNGQVAVGLTFGQTVGQEYHLFGGGRLSWVQVPFGGGASSGWGLGAVGGIGFRAAAKFSPVSTLAVDKLFGLGDAYGYKVTAGTGVRIRVGKQSDPHYAISVLVFRSGLYGSDVAGDRSDFGVAAACSVAFLRRS
jgi:hypothetical protein